MQRCEINRIHPSKSLWNSMIMDDGHHFGIFIKLENVKIVKCSSFGKIIQAETEQLH